MISYGNINDKNGYYIGILGGLLGGLICSIPWIITEHIYGIYGCILAVLIPYGVIKGYRNISGKIDKNMKKIISRIIKLTIVIVAVIINPLLMVKFNVSLLKFYYSNYFLTIGQDIIIAGIASCIGLDYLIKRLYI